MEAEGQIGRTAERIRHIAGLGLTLLLACLCNKPAAAETLVASLSAPRVEISSNFAGAEISVFGVIERDAQTIARRGGYQVAVTIAGPADEVVLRKKERVAGIWISGTAQRFTDVPSFYAVQSTENLHEIAPPVLARALKLGLLYVGHGGKPRGSIGAREPYREALVELKRQQGLYVEREDAVTFLTPNFFRTTASFPAAVPDGLYTVQVYLFADQAYLASTSLDLVVAKSGFEQRMYVFAQEDSLLYGVVVVLIAVFAGWLGGVVFRRD